MTAGTKVPIGLVAGVVLVAIATLLLTVIPLLGDGVRGNLDLIAVIGAGRIAALVVCSLSCLYAAEKEAGNVRLVYIGAGVAFAITLAV